jgi:alkanesulfonate monooxygenase SsuD/methylene tetrahydromethanopterin reductase-like flavin-dependent oxidoreductase (luciferase family)
LEEIRQGRVALTRQIKTDNKRMIGAHIYLVTEETAAEAERSAVFLTKQTSEPLSQVKEWAIVGDNEMAENRIRQYLDAGVGYFVFSVPHSDNYDKTLARVARLVSRF